MDAKRLEIGMLAVAVVAVAAFIVLYRSVNNDMRSPATDAQAPASSLATTSQALPDIEEATVPATTTATTTATTSISFGELAPVKRKSNPSAFPPPVASATSAPPASSTAAPAESYAENSAQSPAPTQSALDASAVALRAALVNIICLAPSASGIRSISGSGVFIGSQGYILTDAHIAQYFLLDTESVSCTIRTGDPAKAAYRAALVFIPAQWIKDNSAVITESSPSGTGERDFAVLAVSGSAVAAPLPVSFSSMPLAYDAPEVGTPVVIGSYAAQFLTFSQIQSALSPTVVFGVVNKILTFTATTPDVVSFVGSAAAQEGSSGGGIADSSRTLIADITTSTIEGDTSSRTVSADTAAYIRREYKAETGASIDVLLATPVSEAIAAFAPQISPLRAILLSALGQK